jgi:outer membrane biosynthesis protein TonB
MPALNMPAPPPRVIEPSPEPPPEPVNDLPAVAPMPPPAPSPRASRPTPRPQTEKPVEKPPEPVPEPPPAPVPQPPAQPAAQLRTPQDTTNASKAVQATIDRANGMLGSINYGMLSNERKKAFDDAKRFIVEAEAAMKQGNLVFAQGVATKAETLARELAGK